MNTIYQTFGTFMNTQNNQPCEPPQIEEDFNAEWKDTVETRLRSLEQGMEEIRKEMEKMVDAIKKSVTDSQIR